MYNYKSKDYDQIHQSWLARLNCVVDRISHEHDFPETAVDFGPVPSDRFQAEIWVANHPAHPLSRNFKRLIKSEPQIEWVLIEPGDVYIDIVTGPPTALKLLYHSRYVSKVPHVDINNIVRSQKAKHRNRGPYYHALKINIYPSNMELWDSKFYSKEIDLWQDIQDVDVTDVVKEASTPALQPRIYRY